MGQMIMWIAEVINSFDLTDRITVEVWAYIDPLATGLDGDWDTIIGKGTRAVAKMGGI